VAQDVVGDRTDGQRALAAAGRVHIQRSGLHLDGHNAHLFPREVCLKRLGHAAVVAVEPVGGEQIADLIARAHLLGNVHAGAQEAEIGDRRERAGQMILPRPAGVGAGALRDDDVPELQLVSQRAGGADAQDVLHAVDREQLPRVNADGRHTHAGGHDGDAHAVIGAGVALNAPDVVDEHGIGQEIFRDEFRAQRIAGHQDSLSEVAGPGADVRGRIIGHDFASFR